MGLPVPGSVARIVDLDTGAELDVGEVGEIVITGPMVVPGYWEKPAESEQAIRPDGLHTGDVGFMDAEGWFYIVDRAKDQINAGGYKIWPRDVEGRAVPPPRRPGGRSHRKARPVPGRDREGLRLAGRGLVHGSGSA